VTVFALGIAVASLPVSASPLPGTASWDSGFNGNIALQHVQYLASDVCKGRYSGFDGADVADKYIVNHFNSIGLERPFGGDGYLHRFAYGAGQYVMPSGLVIHSADGRADTAKMWQHMNIFKYSGFGKVHGKVVLIGYGVSAPELGWDDYAGVDVNGAIVLAWRGTPEVEGKEFGSWGYTGKKSSFAFEKGAVGFIYCETDPPKLATITERYFREDMPSVWVSKTFADTLLRATGKTKDQWKQLADSTKTSVSLALDVVADLQVSGKYYPRRKTDNVAGLMMGTDPALKNEVVVIGAHMDHHGVDAAGNLYPGADDNASGTAAMMELARVFKEKKIETKRSILFIGFAGEEEGLVGSKAFVKSPMLPKGMDVVAMLNMDMVGQGNCSLGVGGISEFPVLGEAMFASWPDSSLKPLEFWGLYDGSDHASFRDDGIPSYVIGARGDHPNYHTPGDSAANIKPEVLKSVGDMMYHCAVSLADYPEPIKPMMGRGQWAIQRYGGYIHNQFETIQIGNDHVKNFALPNLTGSSWPINGRVKGVEYPIPLIITKLMGSEAGGGPWGGTEYFRAIEIIREQANSAGLPFLADSSRKDFPTLAPFLGVSIALNAGDLPYDTLELAALARAGVGFVLGSPGGRLEPWSEPATGSSGPGWKEITQMCKQAGMRLWMSSRISTRHPFHDVMVEGSTKNTKMNDGDFSRRTRTEELTNAIKIAELWDNQLILDISMKEPEWATQPLSDYLPIPMVDSLLARGCFIITNSPEYIIGHQGTPEFARIGIPMDPALCERLLELGLKDDMVGALLFGNLQRSLQK